MALLEVEGVNKRYGGIQALDSCRLSVDRGEIAGLIGPNGSGKTTLFNVITGYEKVRQGTVRLDGKDVTNLSPRQDFQSGRREDVPAHPCFRTAERHGEHARGQPAPAFMVGHGMAAGPAPTVNESGLWSCSSSSASPGSPRNRPPTCPTVSANCSSSLTCSCPTPSVLLLDEPAGGVNPTLLNAISDHIKELNRQGRTFLVVEHNMEFVMGLCHRVTVMDHGSMVVSGPA